MSNASLHSTVLFDSQCRWFLPSPSFLWLSCLAWFFRFCYIVKMDGAISLSTNLMLCDLELDDCNEGGLLNFFWYVKYFDSLKRREIVKVWVFFRYWPSWNTNTINSNWRISYNFCFVCWEEEEEHENFFTSFRC